MRSKFLISAFVLAVAAMPLVHAEGQANQSAKEQAAKVPPAEQRAEIQKNAQATLEEVYKLHPEAKDKIAKAAGYAVFRTGGFQAIILGAGGGDGVAVSGGKSTYMTMIQGKVGLGLGAKETRQVFVFTNKKAYDQFVNKGWTAGGDVTAAAKAGDKGAGISGAIPLGKGVYLYQFTENGLTAEATIAGSKYSKNKELNKK